MQFLRKLGLGLALFLYAPLLLILPTVISLNATLNKPTFIKETVVEAKLYPALSAYILEQVSKSTEAQSSPLIGQTAQSVFTPEALQQTFEPTIDGIYAWLDNPEQPFSISISTKSLQDTFKAQLDQSLGTQLQSLPACSGRTQPTSTDPFQLNCIPTGVTIEQIRQQAQEQINQNPELAQQETISLTEDPVPAEESAGSAEATLTAPNSTEAPKFNTEQFKMLAKLYQITKASTPWIIGLLVLSTLAILLLTTPWFRGLKRLSIFLIINGALLLVSSAGSAFLLRTLLPVPATDGSIGAAGREVANLLTKHMIMTTRNFAVAYLLLGILGVIAAIVLKKKSGGDTKPAPDNPPEEPTPKEPQTPPTDPSTENSNH